MSANKLLRSAVIVADEASSITTIKAPVTKSSQEDENKEQAAYLNKTKIIFLACS